jgi:hypothetical protein
MEVVLEQSEEVGSCRTEKDLRTELFREIVFQGKNFAGVSDSAGFARPLIQEKA